MDRGLDLLEFDTVGLDNESSGYRAGQALTDLGHRKIAVLLPDLELAPSRDRASGVERALRDVGAQSGFRVVTGGHTIDGAKAHSMA